MAADLPLVFFDIDIDGSSIGRIVIQLRSDVVPRTCEYFIALCNGTRNISYKGSPIYHVHRQYCEGGTIRGKATYNECVHENLALKNNAAGTVGMCRLGKKSDLYRFYITFQEIPAFDNLNVVIGRVVEGMDVLEKIKVFGCGFGYGTTNKISIRNSGEYKFSR